MRTDLHRKLPTVIPIFPLSGVILLPSTKLPLNIFEPRYVKMTRDALKSDWIIGMVQPRTFNQDGTIPDVYQIGCAGKIIAFSETDDGRILITLAGIARFKITNELPQIQEYRRTEVDWCPFEDDLHDTELITSLSMQCPFTFQEKQALLEAPGIRDRAELILSLLTMAVASEPGNNPIRH